MGYIALRKNPIYVAVWMVHLGESTTFEAISVLIHTCEVGILLHLFVVFVRNPR